MQALRRPEAHDVAHGIDRVVPGTSRGGLTERRRPSHTQRPRTERASIAPWYPRPDHAGGKQPLGFVHLELPRSDASAGRIRGGSVRSVEASPRLVLARGGCGHVGQHLGRAHVVRHRATVAESASRPGHPLGSMAAAGNRVGSTLRIACVAGLLDSDHRRSALRGGRLAALELAAGDSVHGDRKTCSIPLHRMGCDVK
jgi:hypothetical protein